MATIQTDPKNLQSLLSIPEFYSKETLSTESSVRSMERKFQSLEQKLEKRHFPTLHNKVTKSSSGKPRGRKYIPHGYGTDKDFRPHGQHVHPRYTECGPDWKSMIRYVPSPHNPHYPAEENWPEPWKAMRTYPSTGRRSYTEYNFYPANPSTKKTLFDGLHMSSQTSNQEFTHQMLFGKGRPKWMIDNRNGLPSASPGDKSYQAVEYSPNFHKEGSTLPVVNFGGSANKKPDTFVPLLYPDIPFSQRESYNSKERRRRYYTEIDDVRALEGWRPATPLQGLLSQLQEQAAIKA